MKISRTLNRAKITNSQELLKHPKGGFAGPLYTQKCCYNDERAVAYYAPFSLKNEDQMCLLKVVSDKTTYINSSNYGNNPKRRTRRIN